MRFDVLHGDNLATLKVMESNQFDAVVTDPPYGLGKEPDAIAMLSDWMNEGHHDVTGAGFMGKAWDAFVPQPRLWREVFRVLKPGGHLLSFAGTRTADLVTLGLRLAGFEIRDSIMWAYGSGFPKSLNVSKAIDRMREDDVRPVCRFLRAAIDAGGFRTTGIAAQFGFHPRMVEHWAARDTDSQPTVPTWGQWQQLKALIGFGDEMDAEVRRLNERKGTPGAAWHDREVVDSVMRTDATKVRLGMPDIDGIGSPKRMIDVTLPARNESREWDGWGTALKPACEPVIVARKPLGELTVARNVLKWQTGALNVDGCRIGRDKRWPANVILDDEAATLVDAQSDGVSRFFYCAKASSLDRDEGLDDFEPVRAGAMQGTLDGSMDTNGDGIPRDVRRRNNHPTVKPVSLMRYLVRLVTPAGGRILDPFCGSGSTGKAAMLEGFVFVGLEQDAGYCRIARARIQWAAGEWDKSQVITKTIWDIHKTTEPMTAGINEGRPA